MLTVRIEIIKETKNLIKKYKTRNLGKQTVYQKYIKSMTVELFNQLKDIDFYAV